MEMTTIWEQVAHWAQSDPQRLVYQSDSESYTYQELIQQSQQLAYYLQQNVPEKAPIVVFGELEFEMLVGFLAAAKSGHAYIPIESTTPIERIEMILEAAQPALVLSVKDWPAEINKPIPVLSLAEMKTEMKDFPEVSLQPAEGEDTVYIIFTSGTTGVPKGVQISHDNLASFVQWDLQNFGIEEGWRFLSQAPYSFDLSVMSIYPALCSGGTLIPMEKQIINDFKTLFAFLPTLSLDIWVSTPSFMEICLMEKNFDGAHIPSLKVFQFCGEELPRKTALELIRRFPQAKIFNTYGPTEATVAVSGVEVTEALLEEFDRVPIGYAKEDTEVRLTADHELLIKGPSVSKGYLNNPEKTQEAFFEEEGTRVYRTGDAVTITEDGLLLYEGRIDFQVKLHGYRIELEDIDHHLEQVSYVQQAVVVPKYQQHKVQQLVAYVVATENSFEKEFQLTKAIKEELAERVMDYMIPQRFIYVDQLPLTANGKIDRKGLIAEVNPA